MLHPDVPGLVNDLVPDKSLRRKGRRHMDDLARVVHRGRHGHGVVHWRAGLRDWDRDLLMHILRHYIGMARNWHPDDLGWVMNGHVHHLVDDLGRRCGHRDVHRNSDLLVVGDSVVVRSHIYLGSAGNVVLVAAVALVLARPLPPPVTYSSIAVVSVGVHVHLVGDHLPRGPRNRHGHHVGHVHVPPGSIFVNARNPTMPKLQRKPKLRSFKLVNLFKQLTKLHANRKAPLLTWV